MKQNKGFTLIELLAVIVILATIALIATPIILNVIDDARKSAAKDSGYGYVDAIEKYAVLSSMGKEITGGTADVVIPTGSCDVTATGTDACGAFMSAANATVKGKKPESGTVTFDDRGNVLATNLKFGSYYVNVPVGGEAEVSKTAFSTSSSES